MVVLTKRTLASSNYRPTESKEAEMSTISVELLVFRGNQDQLAILG